MPSLVHEVGGFHVAGRHIDPHPVELFAPVVGRPVEWDHLGMALQDADEGFEERPIEPVAIEIAWCDVRGRDQHDALRKQAREQP